MVAIDAKLAHSPRSIVRRKGLSTVDCGPWTVYINGGRTAAGLDAFEWAKKAEKLGAGEILLTSMDFDGTKKGYDLDLTKAITGAVRIPVIASGGAGKKKIFTLF